jgi:hypothetical protein
MVDHRYVETYKLWRTQSYGLGIRNYVDRESTKVMWNEIHKIRIGKWWDRFWLKLAGGEFVWLRDFDERAFLVKAYRLEDGSFRATRYESSETFYNLELLPDGLTKGCRFSYNWVFENHEKQVMMFLKYRDSYPDKVLEVFEF